MKYIVYPLLLLLLSTVAYSQPDNLETNYNHYNVMAVDDVNFYIGLRNGLVVQNKETGDYNYYSGLNTDLESSYIVDIKLYNDNIYVSTLNGIYLFNGLEFERLPIGDTEVREIIFDEKGNLWTFDGVYVYKYNGESTEQWDIRDSLGNEVEIGKIDIIEENVWVSVYQSPPFYNNYHSIMQERNYRFGLLETETSELTIFKEEDRGFEFWNTISYQAIANNEIWVGIGSKQSFIFDVAKEEWRTNEKLSKIPDGFEMVYSEAVAKDNKVWFPIYNPLDTVFRRYITYYDYESDTIEMVFTDLDSINGFAPYYFKVIGDKLISSDSYAEYIIENDRIEVIEKSLIADDYIIRSNYCSYEDEVYFLWTDFYDRYGRVNIFELKDKQEIKYNISENNKLSVPMLTSYVEDDNLKLVRGGRSVFTDYGDEVYKRSSNNEWVLDSNLGFYNLQYKRFNDGSLAFISGDIYGYRNGDIVNLVELESSKYPYEEIHNFDIKDDKIYTYSSFQNDNIEKKEFDTYVSIIDGQSEVMVYDKENSCLPNFEHLGDFIVYIVGHVPNDIELDNKGNVWCHNGKSIFFIDDKLKCHYRDYINTRENGYMELSKIVYSEKNDRMYGIYGDLVYNLNSLVIDTLNSNYIVGASINSFDECSDGNIYATTRDGRLFKVNEVDDWTPITIFEGKESVNLSLNQVSFYNDTLYIATDIGLLKLESPTTSVEDDNSKGYDLMTTYPNPATNIVNLSGFAEESVYIYDITGKQVRIAAVESGRVDISVLTAGVYFLKDSNGAVVGKFVKE